MKTFIRTAAAGVCLSAFLAPLAAQADTVEMYGIADLGLQFVNHGPGGGNSKLGLASGNLTGSRFGLRGTEDLGDGMKAGFILEGGLDLTSGTSLQASRLFGRQALVSLSDKEWGTLILGRQNTLMIEWMSKYNPFDNANFSTKLADPAFSDRMDNAAQYRYKLGNLTFATYYSSGWNNEQSFTDAQQGRMIGAGVRYKAGPLDLAALYHSKNADAPKAGADSGNREDRAVFGGRYDLGLFEVFGGYRWLRQSLTTRDYTSNMEWVGLTYHVSEPWKVSGGFYHVQGSVCDDFNNAVCPAAEGDLAKQSPNLIIVDTEYDLSKRTTLYAMGAYSMNNHGSSQSVNGGKYGVGVEPGTNQLGATVGMRVLF
jgi:predicted porin